MGEGTIEQEQAVTTLSHDTPFEIITDPGVRLGSAEDQELSGADTTDARNLSAVMNFYYRPTPTTLCGNCGPALAEVMGRGAAGSHYPFKDYKGRPASCDICSSIWEEIASSYIRSNDSSEHAEEDLNGVGDEARLMFFLWPVGTLDVSLQNAGKVHAERKFFTELKPSRTSSQALGSINDNIPDDVIHKLLKTTGSYGPLSLGWKWIQECPMHPNCSQPRNEWLPHRLLDLDVPGCGSTMFRVVNMAGNGFKTAQYMTLSHCWGDADFLQLNKETSQPLAVGMEIERLPKTFREAVAVCRFMKIRYLWIDSLCIMQDDKADWASQAAEMSKVYLNAFCNIAADASEDSSQGLFRSRSLDIFKDNRPWSFQDPSILDNMIYGRRLMKPKWGLVAASPLNTRACVLQERLLAPRVLHFTERELFWECRSHMFAESSPDRTPKGVIRDQRELSLRHFVPPAQCNPYCNICYHWANVVYAYNMMELSYDTDRPVAILGLASYIQGQIQDQYIVGLWRKHLTNQLNWEVERKADNRTMESLAAGMPSFSWLSLDALVNFPRSPYHCLKISDVIIGDLKADRNCIEQDYRLEVVGLLVPIVLTRGLKDYHWGIVVPPQSSQTFHHSERWQKITPDLARYNLPLESRGSEHYALPISFDINVIYLLILEQVTEGGSSFRRVGHLSLVITGMLRRPDEDEPGPLLAQALGLDRKVERQHTVEDWTSDPEAVRFWFV